MLEVREIFRPEITDDIYKSAGIKRPEDCDSTIGIFDGGELLATASIRDNILVGFAVSSRARGEGLLATLCTALINIGMSNGHRTFYIFTKPEKAFLFSACGFREIARNPPYSALLEWGETSVDQYVQKLRAFSRDKPDGAGCIVMNANPFTLGHRYLAEYAAGESRWLYVVVVEAEKSIFPFHVRMELIQKGLRDLPNVTVLGGGQYVISALTFPTYFSKEGDVGPAQTGLDLALFCSYIAPALKVKRRYVGEEPYCETTRAYNKSMKAALPPRGIEVVEIPRKEKDGEYISASHVRNLIREGKTEQTKKLLPESTYEFLLTPEGEEIAEKIRHSNDRHG